MQDFKGQSIKGVINWSIVNKEGQEIASARIWSECERILKKCDRAVARNVLTGIEVRL